MLALLLFLHLTPSPSRADTPAVATTPTPAAALAMADCNAAKRKLRLFSMSFRAYCAHDSDCSSFIVAADPCGAPEILRKDLDLVHDKDLKALQAKAAADCAPVWAARPACERPSVRPVCRDGKCVDGGPAPTGAKASK
ncbi:MAG: hypothetical protein ACXVC0_09065 [Bdellovibrionota bacterium]